jgi:hypothetical protein
MRGWKNLLRLVSLPSASRPDRSSPKGRPRGSLYRVRFDILILLRSHMKTPSRGRGSLFSLQSRKFLSLGDDGDDQKQYRNNQETQRDGPGDKNRKIPTGEHQ